MLKAVILIGGPQKGTRFRPLSLDIPKPLFPVAGLPLIQHHIEACSRLEECKEILIIGSYTSNLMAQFVSDMQKEYQVTIRYLQEFAPLGTGGGLHHFRDQVRAGAPRAFFLLNGDVCADFPLRELWDFHRERPSAVVTIMGTEATEQQATHYGCLALAAGGRVTHYVEKPGGYVSTLINCGVYVCGAGVFAELAAARQARHAGQCGGGGGGGDPDHLSWEQDVLSRLAGTDKLYAMQVCSWWSQLKTPGAAIYANRHYLQLYRARAPRRLARAAAAVRGDVTVHETAVVHATACVGPNVSLGAGARVAAGVRLRECIVLDGAVVQEHALVMHAVVGQNAVVGAWARVEGTPTDPDPDKPFAKMDSRPLFNADGRLNPSITILGAGVVVPPETILLNSIVLPHKHLTRSYKHEIIL